MLEEDHLGGFIIEGDPATFTPNLWKFLCENFEVKSVVDVGCGMGYAVKEFKKHCNNVLGIDGSKFVIENSDVKDSILHFDFCNGSPDIKPYDLCWSCEFVEHVDERYLDNFLKIFCSSKYLAITYAGPGQSGHHHVNCQPAEYWIEKMEQRGMVYSEQATNILKQEAEKDGLIYNPRFRDNHFFNRGLFFINGKL